MSDDPRGTVLLSARAWRDERDELLRLRAQTDADAKAIAELKAYLHFESDENGEHHRDWVADCQSYEKVIAEQNECLAVLRQFLKDTVTDMVCMPECDSHAHSDLCPVAYETEAWRRMNIRLAEYERICGPKLECCGRYAVEHLLLSVYGPLIQCATGALHIAPPEYLAWRESRRPE